MVNIVSITMDIVGIGWVMTFKTTQPDLKDRQTESSSAGWQTSVLVHKTCTTFPMRPQWACCVTIDHSCATTNQTFVADQIDGGSALKSSTCVGPQKRRPRGTSATSKSSNPSNILTNLEQSLSWSSMLCHGSSTSLCLLAVVALFIGFSIVLQVRPTGQYLPFYKQNRTQTVENNKIYSQDIWLAPIMGNSKD